MSFFGIPYFFQDMTTFDAEQLNADFTALLNAANSLQAQVNTINTGGGGGGTTLPTVYVATAAAFGMATTASGPQNQAALQLAVNTALTNGGGSIFIPAGTYNISGTVNVVGAQPQNGLVIYGSSLGTQLVQQQANSDTFNISGFSGGSGAGCHFSNLWFQYPNQSVGTGIAVHITGGSQGVDCTQCYFNRCPQAFVCDAGDGLQCGLRSCIVIQNNYVNTGVGQVDLGCTQGFVDGCLIRQNNGPFSGGPTGNIGIRTNGGNSIRITNTQVSAFDYGINIAGGATQRIWITNSQIETATTGITIAPTVLTKTIYGVYINNVDVKMAQNSTNTNATGIYIDTFGGANTNTENINIVGCSVYGWNGSGIQINSARNVNIVGGMISSNGLNPVSTLLGCGVTLSNGSSQPSGIHCVGVDFNGTYDFVGGTQPYAVGVTGGGSLRCWSCTMTGNGSGQVFTTSIIGTPDIKLYNCTGYNDSATSVNTGTISSGNAFTLAGLGYYGPGTFYVNGGTITSIVVGSVTTHMGANSTIVIPDSRTSVNITWSGSPTNMTIVGG